MIGHGRSRDLLRHSEHYVVLLLGPEHSGKKTLIADYLAEQNVHRTDQVWTTLLTADKAREIVQTVVFSGLGPWKAVVINLDGSSAQAQNILLKVLEEPPARVRFFLTGQGPVLPTIASRCVNIHMGLLRDEQVAEVLVLRGMDRAAAERQAPLGAGRVRPALQAVVSGPARSKVTAALKAVIAGDTALLERVLAGWDEESHDLLAAWAWEASTGRWRQFERGAPAGLSQADARNLLDLLSQHVGTRVALAARVVLTTMAAAR